MRVVETPHPMGKRGRGGGRSAAGGAKKRPASARASLSSLPDGRPCVRGRLPEV